MATSIRSLGQNLDDWAEAIHPHVIGLSPEEQLRLLTRHQASGFDELALTLSKRYPTIDPITAPDVIKKYFKFSPLAAEDPSFTKSPTHDRDPYDRDDYHERAGFSRTHDIESGINRLINRGRGE